MAMEEIVRYLVLCILGAPGVHFTVAFVRCILGPQKKDSISVQPPPTISEYSQPGTAAKV